MAVRSRMWQHLHMAGGLLQLVVVVEQVVEQVEGQGLGLEARRRQALLTA